MPLHWWIPDHPIGTVAFSHGAWAQAQDYALLAQGLSDAGYVVVAPDHDPSFWASAQVRLDELKEAINQAQVAYPGPLFVAGHSLGGRTALGIQDARIAGRIAISPSANSPASFYAAASGPLLYMYGGFEGDKTFPYQSSQAPKYHDIVPLAGHFSIVQGMHVKRVIEMSVALMTGDLPKLRTSDLWAE